MNLPNKPTLLRRAAALAAIATLVTAGRAQQTDAPKTEPPEVQPTKIVTPPGTYTTSWVGNSFGGDGGPNGFGYWVQNGADEIEVTPDGTVLAGLTWDEAGRCAGLYKDGKVNRTLLKAEGGSLPDSAWGWGTGNNALAVWGEDIYIASTGKKLLHFRWKPGDLESARFVSAEDMTEEAVGLAARNGMLAVVTKDGITLRSVGGDKPSQEVRRFAVPGAQDVAIASDSSLWVVAGQQVRHLSADGKDLGVTLPGVERPSAVSLDRNGQLIVCDDGPRQQVLFFDVTGTPRLVRTFGERGGLRAGVPGIVAPKKLFALRGAGTDASGNLYVACSFGNGPAGNLVLRSFAPGGNPRWEVLSTAFVDTFGWEPGSDGKVVYTRTAVFDLDLGRKEPGNVGKLRAVTLDHVGQPQDDRLKNGYTALPRTIGGRRALFCIGQYAGGYRIYTFDEPKGHLARQVAQIGGSEQWAWDVTEGGDIWHGDAPEKTVRRYRFRGWTSDGKPNYAFDNPETFPWPDGWQVVRRIHYVPENDTLYLTGYRDGERVETWGVAGATVCRYDGWLRGKRQLRWTRPLPRDGNLDPNEGPLTPSSVTIAGDYLFAGMVKPTEGKQVVHILRLSDGAHVGTFTPDASVGEGTGWLDMPYSTQALRRKNGEYLILVEEDWRGKNLIYRWRPNAATAKQRTASKS